MDPALLKHLALSRSVVVATFFASAALYVGPRIAPSYIDAVPKEWSAVLVAVLVFSGVLLSSWALSESWGAVKSRWQSGAALTASYRIDQNEMELLLALGENPSEPLDLGRVDYERIGLSKLEVLELAHELKGKGLVYIIQFQSENVSLTATGRQRALDLQRAAKSSQKS